VDDEPAIRRFVARALAREGIEVVEAEDGRVAIAAVEADPARLAILVCDLTLPGVGGDTVIRRARALRPDLPVLVMTGWDPVSVEEALDGVGPVRLLAKPFTLADVRAAVDAALPL
jgi:DNA-binding response OmpR family regulator